MGTRKACKESNLLIIFFLRFFFLIQKDKEADCLYMDVFIKYLIV